MALATLATIGGATANAQPHGKLVVDINQTTAIELIHTAPAPHHLASYSDLGEILWRIDEATIEPRLATTLPILQTVRALRTRDWEYVLLWGAGELPEAELWRSPCGEVALQRVTSLDARSSHSAAARPDGIYYVQQQNSPDGRNSYSAVCYLPDSAEPECLPSAPGTHEVLGASGAGALIRSTGTGTVFIWQQGTRPSVILERVQASRAVVSPEAFYVWEKRDDADVVLRVTENGASEDWRGSGLRGVELVNRHLVLWTRDRVFEVDGRDELPLYAGSAIEDAVAHGEGSIVLLDCSANWECGLVSVHSTNGAMAASRLHDQLRVPRPARWARVDSHLWYEPLSGGLFEVDLLSGSMSQVTAEQRAWTTTDGGIAWVDMDGSIRALGSRSDATSVLQAPSRTRSAFPQLHGVWRDKVVALAGLDTGGKKLVAVAPDGEVEQLSEAAVRWVSAADGEIWYVEEHNGLNTLLRLTQRGSIEAHGEVSGSVEGLIASTAGTWLIADGQLHWAARDGSSVASTSLVLEANQPLNWGLHGDRLYIVVGDDVFELEADGAHLLGRGSAEARGATQLLLGGTMGFVDTCGSDGRDVFRIGDGALQRMDLAPRSCASRLVAVGRHLLAIDEDGISVAAEDGAWRLLLETTERPAADLLRSADDGGFYFVAATVETGRELWRSDGTIAGTRLAADLTPGSGSTTFAGAVSLSGGNGLLLYEAGTADGYGLYAVVEREVILLTSSARDSRGLFVKPSAVVIGDTLFYVSYDLRTGAELYQLELDRMACRGCCDESDCAGGEGTTSTCVDGLCVDARPLCDTSMPEGPPLEISGKGCDCRHTGPPNGPDARFLHIVLGLVIVARRFWG